MPWLTEQEERLEAFRRGDRRVLTEAYAMYAPKVAAMLRGGFSFASEGGHFRFHGLESAFELDDVLQETFLRAFSPKTRAAFDGLRPFGAYVSTIARNLIISRCRRKESRCTVLTAEDPRETGTLATQPDGQINPEISAVQRELAHLLDFFRKSLDSEDLEVFRLRFEQRATRAAVTAQTGLSPMQIRTRERHLRKRLYDELVRAGHGDAAAIPSWLLLIVIGTGV